MRDSTPKFIQGIFPFAGSGLDNPQTLASYSVPPDKRAQLVYMRAGNSAAELVCLSVLSNGKLLRFFPLGAKSAEHVALAVVEDIFPDTHLEIAVAAPAGTSGTVIVDFAFVEI